jgi:hypothetical protein
MVVRQQKTGPPKVENLKTGLHFLWAFKSHFRQESFNHVWTTPSLKRHRPGSNGKVEGLFSHFSGGTSDATRYIASASRSLDHRKALGFQVHVGVAGNATVEIEMLEITRGSWAKTQCCRLIWQESNVYLVSSLAKPLSNGATPWQRFTAVYPSLCLSSPLFCRQCPHCCYESLTLDGYDAGA